MIAMEDSSTANGVFLYTKKLDSELMLKCMQALLNSFPDIKFISVATDEKCLGYRVHFSDPGEETVLAKKNLSVSGQDILICPLTTCLTIHDINANGDEQLESDICEAINNRFGKLLLRINIPKSPGPQNDNMKNWRAYIDIPEVKELTVFDHEGFSEMCMWLPNKKEKLKVTFCCRRCRKDGHIQQDCLYKTQRKMSDTDERLNKNDSNSFTSSSVKSLKIPLDSTETFAEKVGREEVMKTGILLGENRENKEKETGSNKAAPKEKESEDIELPSLDWSSITIKNEAEGNDDHTKARDEKAQNTEAPYNKGVPKTEPSDTLNINQNSNSNSPMDDDDVQLIGYKDNSNSSNTQYSFQLKSEDKGEAANADENSSSPTKTRSIQRSSSTFSSTPGPSSRNHNTTRLSKSVEVTSVLGEHLQDCINSACESGPLDRPKLDAFLIHVKKKSNPLRVAKNYTENTAGLKDQLQHILKQYYITPQTGTKDDIQFIKWLDGLVVRFEGTVPKKRKRAGQNHDDTPSKK